MGRPALLLQKRDIRLFVATIIAIIACAYGYTVTYIHPFQHLACITLVFVSAIPKRLIHPSNVLFGFHFFWYTYALVFATRYQNFNWNTEEEVLCFVMLMSTFLIGYNTFHYTQKYTKTKRNIPYLKEINKIPYSWIHVSFIGLTIASCLLQVYMVGGNFIEWIFNAGIASQNREGGGPATILLIFTSGIAFTTIGYYLIKSKLKLVLAPAYVAFLGFVFLFLVGRAKLLSYLLFAFVRKAFSLRLNITTIVVIGSVVLGSIFTASYLRRDQSEKVDDIQDVGRIALNYFDTYHALYKSVKFEEPKLFSTTFMAANKFLSPFGLKEGVYYTISIKLTRKHFPAYGRRTTVQFPIETDLYLGLYYVFGIPLLIFYFWMVAYIYTYSIEVESLAFKYVSAIILTQLVSHLRGMLFDWTDLFMYPILIVSFLVLHHRGSDKYLNSKAEKEQAKLT